MAGDLDGFNEMLSALTAMTEQVLDVTPDLLEDAAGIVLGETAALLSLVSHEPGTPTPSSPGTPPAQITGTLLASIVPSPIVGDGGTWEIQVGPTAPYGRIQELGGITGRGHRTTLPPRPYLLPAVEASIDAINDLFSDGWASALS